MWNRARETCAPHPEQPSDLSGGRALGSTLTLVPDTTGDSGPEDSEAHELDLAIFGRTVLAEQERAVKQLLVAKAIEGAGKGIAFGEFDQVHILSIEALVGQGVLTTTAGEFGEVLYQVRPSSLVWSLHVVVSDAADEMLRDRGVCSYDKMSKIELVLALLYKGFEAIDGGVLQPMRPGDKLKFLGSDFFRNAEYFKALNQLDSLWAKGVPQVLHHRPKAYYECLLTLSGERLRTFLALPGLDQLSSKQMANFLAGKELDAPQARRLAAAPADDDAGHEVDDVDEGAMADDALVRHVPLVMEVPSMTVSIGGEQYIVHYDSCSHSHGNLRAYIRCAAHAGQACIKYTQVRFHPSRERCVAFLVAWSRIGHSMLGQSKGAHLRSIPTDAEIDEVAQAMPQ